MKKLLLYIFLFLLIFIFSPKTASADIINPDYYSKTCPPGEIEVQCSYKSDTPFGPRTFDECKKYENNPNYKFLDANGHSFGGSQKFCFKAVSTDDFIVYHLKTLLPLILITLLLEVSIFLIIISRSRKALFTALSANLISISLLYLATIILPFTGFTALIVMELIVVIVEAVFIKLMLKDISFRRIFVYSFVANAMSAFFGSWLLNIINGLMKV